MRLKTVLLDGSPYGEANPAGQYLVVDTMTNKQFLARVTVGHEHETWVRTFDGESDQDIGEFPATRFRWIRIEDLDAKALDRLLMGVA